MNEDELSPALRRARYGKAGRSGDRFVEFWLALFVEARRTGAPPGGRRVKAIVERFFAGREVAAALAEAGLGTLCDQLRDASRRYCEACLADPQYATSLIRARRPADGQVRVRIAAEVARVSGALAGLGDSGRGEALSAALVDGYLEALAPHGREELDRALGEAPPMR